MSQTSSSNALPESIGPVIRATILGFVMAASGPLAALTSGEEKALIEQVDSLLCAKSTVPNLDPRDDSSRRGFESLATEVLKDEARARVFLLASLVRASHRNDAIPTLCVNGHNRGIHAGFLAIPLREVYNFLLAKDAVPAELRRKEYFAQVIGLQLRKDEVTKMAPADKLNLLSELFAEENLPPRHVAPRISVRKMEFATYIASDLSADLTDTFWKDQGYALWKKLFAIVILSIRDHQESYTSEHIKARKELLAALVPLSQVTLREENLPEVIGELSEHMPVISYGSLAALAPEIEFLGRHVPDVLPLMLDAFNGNGRSKDALEVVSWPLIIDTPVPEQFARLSRLYGNYFGGTKIRNRWRLPSALEHLLIRDEGYESKVLDEIRKKTNEINRLIRLTPPPPNVSAAINDLSTICDLAYRKRETVIYLPCVEALRTVLADLRPLVFQFPILADVLKAQFIKAEILEDTSFARRMISDPAIESSRALLALTRPSQIERKLRDGGFSARLDLNSLLADSMEAPGATPRVLTAPSGTLWMKLAAPIYLTVGGRKTRAPVDILRLTATFDRCRQVDALEDVLIRYSEFAPWRGIRFAPQKVFTICSTALQVSTGNPPEAALRFVHLSDGPRPFPLELIPREQQLRVRELENQWRGLQLLDEVLNQVTAGKVTLIPTSMPSSDRPEIVDRAILTGTQVIARNPETGEPDPIRATYVVPGEVREADHIDLPGLIHLVPKNLP